MIDGFRFEGPSVWFLISIAYFVFSCTSAFCSILLCSSKVIEEDVVYFTLKI